MVDLFKNKKIFVYAGLILPSLAVIINNQPLKVFDWNISPWIPVAIAALSIYMFNDFEEYIPKRQQQRQYEYIKPPEERTGWILEKDETTGQTFPKKVTIPPSPGQPTPPQYGERY